MGADLYLNSLYDPQRKEWGPRFDAACEERDRLPHGTPEYEAAQDRVLECYEHLNECGYFRDSYNNSNVLSQFGLDWWGDVIPLLDPEGMLSPEKAERLLALLDEHEQEFEANVRELRRESRAYFEKKATQLRAFLAEAIRLAEPIECSL